MCFSIGRTQDVHEGSPEIVEAAHTDMIFRDMCVIFTIGSLVTMVWFSHEFFGDPKTEAYNNWVGMTGYGDHHDKFPLSTHITWPTDKMQISVGDFWGLDNKTRRPSNGMQINDGDA